MTVRRIRSQRSLFVFYRILYQIGPAADKNTKPGPLSPGFDVSNCRTFTKARAT